MSDLSNVPATGDGAYVPPSAGAALRAAREGAGLSIDAVAQQLKLAPRQVQALEGDDFARLPGRTFVRGFVRNYARYVGLDPDEVVALLPGADVAPSLERPTITPSGRPMGELPADAPARRSFARWLIPLALIAIVAAAGLYEFRRPQPEPRRASADKAAPAPPSVTATGGGTTTASLPNPLGAGEAPATPPSGGPMAEPAAALPPGASPAAVAPAAAAPAATEPAAATDAGKAAPAAAGSDAALVLTFRGTSWVQVKDRNGNVVFAQTGQPGTTQSVTGALPLDIVIGNAAGVGATFRGQGVDLAPYVRGNVARLSLK